MNVLIHFILIFWLIVLHWQIYHSHSNFLLNLSSSNDTELAIMKMTTNFDFKLPVDDFFSFFSDYETIVSCLYFCILVTIC
jgi:hypothetical protein